MLKEWEFLRPLLKKEHYRFGNWKQSCSNVQTNGTSDLGWKWISFQKKYVGLTYQAKGTNYTTVLAQWSLLWSEQNIVLGIEDWHGRIRDPKNLTV